MRLIAVCLTAFVLSISVPRAAQSAEPPDAPSTPELIEDLRLFAILNALRLTPEQCTRLAAVAETGNEGLAAIQTEMKAGLEARRAPLTALRERLLRGDDPPGAAEATADSVFTFVGKRDQRSEVLLRALADQVQKILTPEQAAIIEIELAPTVGPPWRRYSRGNAGPHSARYGNIRLFNDPGNWIKALRDLRSRAATGDPQVETEAFARKLSGGMKSGSPLFDRATALGRELAAEALRMSPLIYNQRELSLAQQAAKHQLQLRNQQHAEAGRPPESFHWHRWLVEQVIFSSRAAEDLRQRASLR
jgi:hypothetical protein